MSPTGGDLDSTVFQDTPVYKPGYLGKQYCKITPVGDILGKMPSSRQEQNWQNQGIMEFVIDRIVKNVCKGKDMSLSMIFIHFRVKILRWGSFFREGVFHLKIHQGHNFASVE